MPYFQTDHVFSEDMDQRWNEELQDWEGYLPSTINHYPKPSRRAEPEWQYRISIKDRILGNLLADVYGALNAELYVPAAVATRTLFDRASAILDVDPALNFNEKLKELLKKGSIGNDEKATLEVLTDAGGAAAHRGWRPKQNELDTLVTIVETFLHRVFILPADASELAQSIPTRPQRSKKSPKSS
jgi:hypothetical protein